MLKIICISINPTPENPNLPMVWKVTVAPKNITENSRSFFSDQAVPANKVTCLKYKLPKIIPNNIAMVAEPKLWKMKRLSK